MERQTAYGGMMVLLAIDSEVVAQDLWLAYDGLMALYGWL